MGGDLGTVNEVVHVLGYECAFEGLYRGWCWVLAPMG